MRHEVNREERIGLPAARVRQTPARGRKRPFDRTRRLHRVEVLNPSFDELEHKALYELRGVKTQGQSIRAMLRRNAVGFAAFKALFGSQQVVEVDEKRCFELSEKFNSLGDRSLSGDNFRTFNRAGAAVQRAKLNKGIKLDCQPSSHLDSMTNVTEYSDS
jgi:hypothetical protein